MAWNRRKGPWRGIGGWKRTKPKDPTIKAQVPFPYTTVRTVVKCGLDIASMRVGEGKLWWQTRGGVAFGSGWRQASHVLIVAAFARVCPASCTRSSQKCGPLTVPFTRTSPFAVNDKALSMAFMLLVVFLRQAVGKASRMGSASAGLCHGSQAQYVRGSGATATACKHAISQGRSHGLTARGAGVVSCAVNALPEMQHIQARDSCMLPPPPVVGGWPPSVPRRQLEDAGAPSHRLHSHSLCHRVLFETRERLQVRVSYTVCQCLLPLGKDAYWRGEVSHVPQGAAAHVNFVAQSARPPEALWARGRQRRRRVGWHVRSASARAASLVAQWSHQLVLSRRR